MTISPHPIEVVLLIKVVGGIDPNKLSFCPCDGIARYYPAADQYWLVYYQDPLYIIEHGIKGSDPRIEKVHKNVVAKMLNEVSK